MNRIIKIIFVLSVLMHINCLPAVAVFSEDAQPQKTADEITAKKQQATEAYQSRTVNAYAYKPAKAAAKVEQVNAVVAAPKKEASVKLEHKDRDILFGLSAIILAIIASLALIIYNKKSAHRTDKHV